MVDSVRVHCGDGRFQRVFLEAAEKHGLSDAVVEPGGVHDLLDLETRPKVIMNIGIYVDLHTPRHLRLFQHEDCGRYGGSKKFPNSDAERLFHRKELEKAAGVLQEVFPLLQVQLYFVTLTGDVALVDVR